MANPIVSAITGYVEEHKSDLLVKSMLGGKSASLFNLMVDCKGDTALNLLDVEPVIQDGSDCGWDEAGTIGFSNRILKAKPLKVNMGFCDKKLLSTYAQHEVKVAAGKETMPFEEKITTQIKDGVQEKLETMIYFGNKNNANEFDGIVTILNAETSPTVTGSYGSSAYVAIKAVYMKMPAAVAKKSDAVILVSTALFREFIQELVSANLYHHNANDAEGEYALPGTNCKVIAVGGLDNTNNEEYIIGARLSNLVIGISGDEDVETLDAWYSKDNREFRFAEEFVMGSQIAYLNEVTWGKLS